MGSIVEVGLTNAAVVAVLALVVGSLGAVCRRPALVHSLWVLVLLKLLTPPLVSVPLPNVSWTQPTAEPIAVYVLEAVDLDEAVFEEAAPEVAEVVAEPQHGLVWQNLLGLAWVMGTVGWLGVTLTRVGRFGRVLAEAERAPIELQVRVDNLAQRLGLAHGPEVRVVDGVISPMVWALFGPAQLILPTGLWNRLSEDQRTTLLVHELAHLRRRDHWVRHLELIATAIYWWHPALWWARRALREAEEECCDAWVIWAMPKSNKTYASALLEAVDFLCQAPCPSLPLGASGAGPVKPLKRRLLMILRGITPKSLSLGGRIAVLGLASVLLPILPSTTTAQQPEEKTLNRRLEIKFLDKDGDKKDRSEDEVIIQVNDDDKAPAGANPRKTARVLIFKSDQKPGADDKTQTLTFTANSDDDEADDEKPKVSAEKKAEIQKARAEVKDAQAKLQAAVMRLVELEGRNAHIELKLDALKYQKSLVTGFKVAQDAARATATVRGRIARPIPPIPPVPPLTPTAPGPAVDNQKRLREDLGVAVGQIHEKRMEAIEKRLEKLLDEMQAIRKDQKASPDRR